MMSKEPLIPGRVRRPPASGWSWVDRAFLADHASGLSAKAILLYLFLAAVGDRMGLSFWSDAAVAARLHIGEDDIARSRSELLGRDLIAYRNPLTQVLSLPTRATDCGGRGPMSLKDILSSIAPGIGPGKEGRR